MKQRKIKSRKLTVNYASISSNVSNTSIIDITNCKTRQIDDQANLYLMQSYSITIINLTDVPELLKYNK